LWYSKNCTGYLGAMLNIPRDVNEATMYASHRIASHRIASHRIAT
jgi:hypothetical protein